MSLSMRIPLLIIGVLFLGSITAVSSVVPIVQSVDEYLESYALEADEQARRDLVIELLRDVTRGQMDLDPVQAERLSLFVLDRVLSGDETLVRYYGWEFLAKNPHPAVADPLADHIRETYEKDSGALPKGIDVLASLHDDRALPYLFDALSSSNLHVLERAIGYLEDLGDARALEALEELRSAPSLESRLIELKVEERRRYGKEPNVERATRSAHSEANKLRTRIDRALRNIALRNDHGIICPFDLDDRSLQAVVTDGFAVLPQQKNELYEFYDAEYPFITVDVIFHTYMILQRAAVDELERFAISDHLLAFSEGMMEASLLQASDPRCDRHRELCLQNATFFAVPVYFLRDSQLGNEPILPEPWQARFLEETASIESGQGIRPSEILGYTEDYSEYKLRGRHASSDVAGTFRAMTWLGRGVFPISSPSSLDATRRALLMLAVLDENAELKNQWLELDELITFLAGYREDPSFGEYRQIAEEVTGQQGSDAILALLDSKDRFARFQASLASLPRPQVNSQYVGQSGREHWQSLHHGFRILGQRATADSRLFQSLMDRNVWPPSGLHIAASLLGSGVAAEMTAGDPEVEIDSWTEEPGNLVESALWCFETVFNTDDNAPELFQGQAWERKQINASLGAWSEARHAAAPYLKSAHVYMGISTMTDKLHGYVEPYPEFFERLALLAGRLHRKLDQFGIYESVSTEVDQINKRLDEQYERHDPPPRPGNTIRGKRKSPEDEDRHILYNKELGAKRLDASNLPEFIEILEKLTDLASRELAGEAQTITDGIFLKDLGRRLRHLSFNHSSLNVAEEPMSRVIDVAVDYQSGLCLEAAVGRPLAIYVAIPQGERQFICRGGVYSYYEFTRLLEYRLDDAAWGVATDRLRANGTPPFLLSEACGYEASTLTRSELLDLKSLGQEHERQFYSRRLWMFFERWDGPRNIMLDRVHVDDVDVLMNMIEDRSVHCNVAIFALDHLVDFVDEPEVFRFFETCVSSFRDSRGREIYDREKLVRLYYAIAAMGESRRPEAGELLLIARASLDRKDLSGHWQAKFNRLESLVQFSLGKLGMPDDSRSHKTH